MIPSASSTAAALGAWKLCILCLPYRDEAAAHGLQVINVRTLKPLDRDTIVASLRKTHRLVCTEEGWPQSGFGSEIISVAIEEAFDELDAPPERVTGAEVRCPV